MDFILNAVQTCHKHGGERQIGVACAVREAHFDPIGSWITALDVRDSNGRRAVSRRVGQQHRRFVARHIFIGNFVGASALAAINISMPAFALFAAMVFMLAVGGAVVLLPIGLIPLLSSAGLYYGIVAVLLGLGYLVSAISFLRNANDTTARRMLRASFIYLPGVLLALLI